MNDIYVVLKGGDFKMNKLNEIGQTLCIVFAGIGTLLSSYLGGWDTMLKVLTIFIVVDYITGVICAIIDKKLSSSVGFKGIAKKVVILLLVGLAFYLDKIVGTEVFRNLVIMFYIANEGISILENSTKLGVPYPKKLKEILEQLKKDNDKEIVEKIGK